jgi:uncharacterized protein YceK
MIQCSIKSLLRVNRFTGCYLLSLAALCCGGCSSIGSRVIGGGYFSGVRSDAAMIAARETFDPSERVHPVLASLDMPFSFVGDLLFFPYDFYRVASMSSRLALVVEPMTRTNSSSEVQ